MSYLTRMYGRTPNAVPKTSDKNPNRVSGGIRSQGVDTFTLLGEDGVEKRIPTHAYAQSLEEQIKKQRASIDVLERKLARQNSAIQSLENVLRSRIKSA
jgi:hypothetical protein